MGEKSLKDLPEEAIEKIEKFSKAFNIFFKNQKDAEDVFKALQPTISRYLNGTILLPLEVAIRFSEYTKGVVKPEDIYFDLGAYRYDKKKEEEKKALED